MYYHRIPVELTDALVMASLARTRREPRGTVLEWTWDTVSTVSVWVSIVQIPATYAFIADYFKKRAKASDDGKLRVTISGARGQASFLDLHQDESIDEVVKKLQPFLED